MKSLVGALQVYFENPALYAQYVRGQKRLQKEITAMVARLTDTHGTELGRNMRALAVTPRGEERKLELFARAQELDDLNNSTPDAVKVATWHRAKRLWFDLTGESVI